MERCILMININELRHYSFQTNGRPNGPFLLWKRALVASDSLLLIQRIQPSHSERAVANPLGVVDGAPTHPASKSTRHWCPACRKKWIIPSLSALISRC